jgi:hypothetical protein
MSGPEWFCETCQRWVNGLCCPGCLKCDPFSVKWASDREIAAARRKAMGQ